MNILITAVCFVGIWFSILQGVTFIAVLSNVRDAALVFDITVVIRKYNIVHVFVLTSFATVRDSRLSTSLACTSVHASRTCTRVAHLLQAFIIGWTSEFIPKMVYKEAASPNRTLAGYNNWSLSIFDVNDFQNRSVPDEVDPSFGDVDVCRYKDFRYPPGDVDEYKYTTTHWHVLVARLAFVIVFEVL